MRGELDDVETHAAGAEHGDALADPDLGVVVDHAQRRRHRAAHQRAGFGSKSAGIGVTRFSETTEYSLNVVTQPELTVAAVPTCILPACALNAGALAPVADDMVAGLDVWSRPAPISTTTAAAFVAEQVRQELVRAFGAAISPICAPQMPLHRILTSTWPNRSGGNSISSTTSGVCSLDQDGGV